MNTMTIEITPETNTPLPRILIADDQPDVLEALRLLLKGHGYTTESVTSPAALLDSLASKKFDLVLMDLNYARDTTSGREGLDLLAELQAIEGAPPIVVMTGWATVGLAVEAMQRGVGDFVEKPWVNVRLLEILKKQIELGRERRAAKQQAIEKDHAQDKVARQFQRREREVEEAREIQQGFLPQEIPQIPGYQIAGAWQPARTVGGDYYDVLPFDGDAVGLCIADVAGKGNACGHADVKFSGRRSRICFGFSAARYALRKIECACVQKHRRRSIHHVFLRPSRWAIEASLVRKRRAQHAARFASGRHASQARRRRWRSRDIQESVIRGAINRPRTWRSRGALHRRRHRSQ